MDLAQITNMYNFSNKTVVITGGAGILGAEMACALVGCGANVAVIDREVKLDDSIMKRIDTSVGNFVMIYGDVLDKEVMEKAAEKVYETFGKVDALINGAGGNHPGATTSDSQSFFDLDLEALKRFQI